MGQVLCSQRDKVIVREYNVHRLRTSSPAPLRQHLEPILQFDVDYVLDDSFVPRTNREKMEASQHCMFEIFGEPCVENALDGHNSTVRFIFKQILCSYTLNPSYNVQ